MELIKKITLPIKVTGKGRNMSLKIGNLSTLAMVMGTGSAGANMHCYGITKHNGDYIVPKEVFIERIAILEQRQKDVEAKLNIMKEIQKAIKWN